LLLLLLKLIKHHAVLT